MIRFITLTALIVSTSLVADAQTRKFPYEAVITENETYVRSGPGSRYYPTARLARGHKVTVHRHDPGGWYMIAPPPGSFSWIRADYVQQTGKKTGRVSENQVVVRVGTAFGDTRDVEQKRLNRGDTVQILGEKTFTTREGSIRMFKIEPPRGEYRWVPGQFVAAADSIARQPPRKAKPFEEFAPIEKSGVAEQQQPRPDPFAERNPAESGQPRSVASGTKDNPGVVRTERPQATEQEAARLAELDRQFRTMVRLKTSQWDFTAIEAGYQELAAQASTDALKNQLEQRFAALAKYQKIKDQYDDFLRLTQETAARDAQILSRSGQRPEIVSNPPSAPAGSAPGSRSQDVPDGTAVKQMVGAGIVQEAVVAAPNGPRFVLISPAGKVLAFLGSTTVDLNQYLGRSVGVYGKRSFRTDLQTDYIEVESAIPVRLKR